MRAALIGYSGHSFVIIDTLLSLSYNIEGYCEQQEKNYNPFGISYLGSEKNARTLEQLKNIDVFLGLGDNKLRSKIYLHLIENGISCPSIKHTKAIVSPTVSIGKATVIMPGAIINAMAKIGAAVICNTSSVIEHECIIGNYTHIAPGAVLAGNVKVGDGSFIGANAVIKQGVTIGSNVTIGAGAVVIKDIEDGLTFFGNPAKKR